MNYVAGFMFSENQEYVGLVLKEKPDWQKGLYNGIGGKIEPNEGMYDAMCREFQEETGVETIKNDWQNYALITGSDYKVCFLYAFTDKLHDVKTMELESIQIHAVRLLPENKIFNLNWLIPLAIDTHNLPEEKKHFSQ